MEPKKFTVEELLEDASLSQLNCDKDSKEYQNWETIIQFLLEYNSSEKHSEFLWANQVSHIDEEDKIEWNTNMKIDDEN